MRRSQSHSDSMSRLSARTRDFEDSSQEESSSYATPNGGNNHLNGVRRGVVFAPPGLLTRSEPRAAGVARRSERADGIRGILSNRNEPQAVRRRSGASYSKLVLDSMAESLPQPPRKLVSIWREFAEFAFQGSIMDLSAGIIIGGAFGRIVTSFVNDVVMPPIGWLLSGVDFQNLFVLLKRGKKNRITKGRYKSLQVAKEDGAVTVNVGVFLNSVINFVALSVIIFGMVRTLAKFKQKGKKAKRSAPRFLCPQCFMKIDQRAQRCPYCTSDIRATGAIPRDLGAETVTDSDAAPKVKPKKMLKKQLSRELGWKI